MILLKNGACPLTSQFFIMRTFPCCIKCKYGSGTPATNSTLNLLYSLSVFVRFLENVPLNICTLVDKLKLLSRLPSSDTAKCTVVRPLVGLPFSRKTQEDSHEFLTACLNNLEFSLGNRSSLISLASVPR